MAAARRIRRHHRIQHRVHGVARLVRFNEFGPELREAHDHRLRLLTISEAGREDIHLCV